jgi:hypothetical protein
MASSLAPLVARLCCLLARPIEAMASARYHQPKRVQRERDETLATVLSLSVVALPSPLCPIGLLRKPTRLKGANDLMPGGEFARNTPRVRQSPIAHFNAGPNPSKDGEKKVKK